MAKVLLIDDDVELTALLSEYLTEEGFEVASVHDGRAGVEAAASTHYDIAVLDIMMPRMNGIEALQRMRKAGNMPVLMLTAKGDNVDRITGLNLGADDYVSKPCTPEELVARLRAILRRSQTRDTADVAALTSGDLTLHPGSRTAEWQGRPLDLTGAEYSILEVLARNVGQLVSKQDVSKRAFGQTLTAFDRRIDVHMSSIRQKLGTRRDGQSWIRTVRGQGYQLVTGQ
jgi:two-component system OmpR family response regulator/two-component system response regulator CpxR